MYLYYILYVPANIRKNKTILIVFIPIFNNKDRDSCRKPPSAARCHKTESGCASPYLPVFRPCTPALIIYGFRLFHFDSAVIIAFTVRKNPFPELRYIVAIFKSECSANIRTVITAFLKRVTNHWIAPTFAVIPTETFAP